VQPDPVTMMENSGSACELALTPRARHMSFSNDGKLTPGDMDMLSRLGIPAELIGRAGVERVTDRDAREKYGIRGDGDMSGLVFPYGYPLRNVNGNGYGMRFPNQRCG
jgi:hypothetical protein